VELTMHFLKTSSLATLALALTALSGCAAYKIEPPAGFVVVNEHDWETRMKAQDNVGLSVRRFDNVKGGTLGFWATDLVKKLGNRGYTLKSQSAVKTKNGKVGTRFDFDYETYDTNVPKFYTAVLVVTDKHKIVLQVAGGREHGATYSARVPEVLGQLKVRGCKLGSKICGGPQPPPLSTPPPIQIADGPTETPTATPAVTPAATPAPAVTQPKP
jgi:hypothetical protein